MAETVSATVSTRMVVLVTGASTGIGKACAQYLGSKGHRVYGTSRNAPEGSTESGAFRLLKMDVTDSGSVARGIALILKREGRIDAVLNNAGIHTVGPIECLPIDEIEKSWQTNCLGTMRVCKEVIPIMRSQGGGRIINMSSVAGTIGVPFQGAYCGSKFAIEGMTEILRTEVRPFGIKVSLIEPGDIRHQDCHSEAEIIPAYAAPFAKAMKVAFADEEKGYPTERIGPLVERILKKRNPRTRYVFGAAFQSAVPMLKRLVPNRPAEWLIRLYYGI